MSSQDLERALAALRQEARGRQAPPHVEAALLAALRARKQIPKPRRVPRWTPAVAAGVVLLLAAGLYWRSARMQGPPASPPAPELIAHQPALPAAAPRASPQPDATPARRKPARRRPPLRPQPMPNSEAVTPFFPLDDTLSLPPIESAQILRVRVSGSTLVRFGVPVNQERMSDPVRADVMFAQDGIARAIRFVK
jgi:hypothetical protein